MRLFSSSFRNLYRFSMIALASALLSGCASYGSFDENEPGIEESIFGDVISIVGTREAEETIEYSARAPLVVPPSTGALPAPRTASIAANDPQWPTGSRERMAQVLASENQTLVYTPGVDGVDIAATQALAARTRQAPRESNAGIDRPLTPDEMRAEQDIHLARQQAGAQRDAQTGVRGRRFLTDPPETARAPSAEAPYGEAAQAAEPENSGWSWWPF